MLPETIEMHLMFALCFSPSFSFRKKCPNGHIFYDVTDRDEKTMHTSLAALRAETAQ